MIEKLRKNKIIQYLILTGIFLFTERTIRSSFLFDFSYRMRTLSTYLSIAAAWVAIVLFFVRKGWRKAGVIPWYLVVYIGVLIPTVLYNAYLPRWYDSLIYSLAPIMLVSVCDRKAYIKVGTYVFLVLSFANYIFELFPQLFYVISEWDTEHFLGFHTQIGFALTLGALFAELNGKREIKIAYYLMLFANVILIRKGVLVVGAAVLLVGLVPKVRKLPMTVLYAVVALLLVFLIFSSSFFEIPFISSFLDSVGKDSSISGRTFIWGGYVHLIQEKPLLGHGLWIENTYFYEPSHYNQTFVHAHNAYLQTLYEGGFLTAMLVALMLFFNRPKNGAVKICLFTVLVMMLLDLDAYYVWYLPALICQIGIIYEKEE